MSAYLYVALGGSVGACLRYFLTQQSTKLFSDNFPYGILLVNVIGSFFLGLLYAWLEQHPNISDNIRLIFGVGLLGALTTFSTFSLDTITLFMQGEVLRAIANTLSNVVLCLLGVYLAFMIVKG
ncbi:fluoride efflux transporter CrcB [Glaciecola petra]|uniref:Fluoride-specific ion channel FluC n=1 Tax=Glaciecola petra TaxID=3075602 RepID=A0ABU2ZNR7_9ALTE|nr:fluoride efflux transporter CrcB [Aestuariibacter sp. P117]MDT0594273.1 fluoride efflux transporter CrcB [Aestuariibacter sp. P117]